MFTKRKRGGGRDKAGGRERGRRERGGGDGGGGRSVTVGPMLHPEVPRIVLY